MENGITKLTTAQITEKWAEKVRQAYEEMSEIPNAEEMIRFLKEPVFTVTFRYSLCRFLRRKYGIPGKAEEKGRCRVWYEDGEGKQFTYCFMEEPGTPFPEEVEAYIELMLLLAKDRGMEGQFQGKHLRRYLLGKQQNISRETLMKMALAFDMDCAVVCELLESMDEVPYNFRDPLECISYFCQYTQESNYWSVFSAMKQAWEETEEEAEKNPQEDSAVPEPGWRSSMMEEKIEDLSFEEEDLAERQKKMIAYLKKHCRQLQGYRRAAYGVLEDLLDELKDLTGAADDTDLTIQLWDPVWVQFYTKKSDRSGINRSDFVPWKDLLDLPKAVYEKPLWRARLAKLRERKVPVEKRDILFLNCMRWALSRDSEGGLNAMNEFMLETNDFLDQCGLAMIYPPNPYDRMILLAICSSSPFDILSDIFRAATDEEKLEEQLKTR